jgi:hypothetical protein
MSNKRRSSSPADCVDEALVNSPVKSSPRSLPSSKKIKLSIVEGGATTSNSHGSVKHSSSSSSSGTDQRSDIQHREVAVVDPPMDGSPLENLVPLLSFSNSFSGPKDVSEDTDVDEDSSSLTGKENVFPPSSIGQPTPFLKADVADVDVGNIILRALKIRFNAMRSSSTRRNHGTPEFDSVESFRDHVVSGLTDVRIDRLKQIVSANVTHGPVTLQILFGSSGAYEFSPERVDEGEGYTPENVIAIPRWCQGGHVQFNASDFANLSLAAMKPRFRNEQEAFTFISRCLGKVGNEEEFRFLRKLSSTQASSSKKRGQGDHQMTIPDLVDMLVNTGFRGKVLPWHLTLVSGSGLNQMSGDRIDELRSYITGNVKPEPLLINCSNNGSRNCEHLSPEYMAHVMGTIAGVDFDTILSQSKQDRAFCCQAMVQIAKLPASFFGGTFKRDADAVIAAIAAVSPPGMFSSTCRIDGMAETFANSFKHSLKYHVELRDYVCKHDKTGISDRYFIPNKATEKAEKDEMLIKEIVDWIDSHGQMIPIGTHLKHSPSDSFLQNFRKTYGSHDKIRTAVRERETGKIADNYYKAAEAAAANSGRKKKMPTSIPAAELKRHKATEKAEKDEKDEMLIKEIVDWIDSHGQMIPLGTHLKHSPSDSFLQIFRTYGSHDKIRTAVRERETGKIADNYYKAAEAAANLARMKKVHVRQGRSTDAACDDDREERL